MERISRDRIEVDPCGFRVEELDTVGVIPPRYYIDGWDKLPGGATVYWSHTDRRIPPREVILRPSQGVIKPTKNSKT
ncbi:MAG: hypothetical protein WC841_02815 [Candidatus Shapirobacteria bacterium]|jgi:hypothetical protein